MRVTVSQMRCEGAEFEDDFAALAAHVKSEGSDLVVLPEMPFHPWLCALPEPNNDNWATAQQKHEAWIGRLEDLGAPWVASSLPTITRTGRVNQGFVWSPDQGMTPVHQKHYLPDEPGYWEATWYGRGDGRFDPAALGRAEADSVKVGFLLCSELWFFQHARAYGQAGVDLLLAPRASSMAKADMWIAGGRTAAFSAGAYCLSANRAGTAGPAVMGGQGWIIAPNGEVLGLTSDQEPFVTRKIDLATARTAKQGYPLNVAD